MYIHACVNKYRARVPESGKEGRKLFGLITQIFIIIVYTYAYRLYIHMYICTCIYVHISIYLSISIYIYMYIYMRVCVRAVCVRVCTHH